MSSTIRRRRAPSFRSLSVLLALLAPHPASAQQHFPADEDLELMVRYLVEDGEAPGIAFGVLEADGTTRAVRYGSAGPGAHPLDTRSVFEIGAITMTFTATLLADMVLRGQVGLEDPVAEYLPEEVTLPTVAGYEITLGDLATHRSGLPAGPDDPHGDMTVADLYERVSGARLNEPGRRYEFSFLGYGLLGHALARAAGVPLPDLLRARVLDPLGMDRTGYGLEGDSTGWVVQGHDDGEVVPPGVASAAMWGATGLRSSVEDMLRFVRANAGPPEPGLGRAMRMAHEIRVERGSPEEDVGYGFSWRTYSVARQPAIIGHGGATHGFTARTLFDPERGIGTVLLANSRGFNDFIARNLLFPDPPAGRQRVQVDPLVLDRYTGAYRGDMGRYRASLVRGHYFIRLEDEGYLTYQPRERVRTRLYAESDTSFYMLRGPYTVTFTAGDDDVRMTTRVDEREPEVAGRTWIAWKVDDDTPPPAVVAKNAGVWTAWRTRTWVLIGLVAALTLAAILRPVWARRSGVR